MKKQLIFSLLFVFVLGVFSPVIAQALNNDAKIVVVDEDKKVEKKAKASDTKDCSKSEKKSDCSSKAKSDCSSKTKSDCSSKKSSCSGAKADKK